jgi:dual specificity phosphatase 3
MTGTQPATIGVANANFVTDFLAVGGDLDMFDDRLAIRQASDLLAIGRITHILDVRLECDDKDFWAGVQGLTYHWDGIDDAGQQVPDEWFDRVSVWARVALLTPNTRILTHCHMGINRGPSTGFAILLALGWEPVAALEAIRTARPIAYVSYAEDALRWHDDRIGASTEVRRHHRAAVAHWRRTHDLDVANVIRKIRQEETR